MGLHPYIPPPCPYIPPPHPYIHPPYPYIPPTYPYILPPYTSIIPLYTATIPLYTAAIPLYTATPTQANATQYMYRGLEESWKAKLMLYWISKYCAEISFILKVGSYIWVTTWVARCTNEVGHGSNPRPDH